MKHVVLKPNQRFIRVVGTKDSIQTRKTTNTGFEAYFNECPEWTVYAKTEQDAKDSLWRALCHITNEKFIVEDNRTSDLIDLLYARKLIRIRRKI